MKSDLGGFFLEVNGKGVKYQNIEFPQNKVIESRVSMRCHEQKALLLYTPRIDCDNSVTE